MKRKKLTFALAELLLIFPAGLFMAALFVRNLQPQRFEPAHSAQQIVTWYSQRPHLGLWVLLIALPLTVLVTGGATLLRRWKNDIELRPACQQILSMLSSHLGTFLIASATVTAAGVLAIVALHLLTD